MQNSSGSHLQPGQPGARPGCFSPILTIVVAGWISIVIFVCQVTIWAMEQVAFSSSMPAYDLRWLIYGVGGLALWLPLLGFARFGPVGLRPLFRAWRFAAAVALWMAPARLLAFSNSQGVSLVQIVVLAGFFVWAWWRMTLHSPLQRFRQAGRWPVGLGLAAAAGGLLLVPWVLWGALGSPIDAFSNGLTALLAGLAAAVILQGVLQPQGETAPAGWWVRLCGAPVVLALLAFGLGVNGNEGLLLLTLPPMGWLATVFWGRNRAELPVWPAAGVALALGISGPLAWIDPDELAEVVTSGSGELIEWALRAAVTSVLIGLALVAVLWFVLRWVDRIRQRDSLSGGPWLPVGMGAASVWLVLGTLYLLAGRPGFYGEQLFVILKDQADLSAPAQIGSAAERRGAVFEALTTKGDLTQAYLRQELDRLGIRYRPYYLVNALEVNGGPLVRAWLAGRPEVDRVLDSPHLRPLPEPLPVERGIDAAPTSPQWNLTQVRANLVWDELKVTGKGIVVGQSDSGVDGLHPELKNQYRGRNGQNDYAWFDPWNHSPAPVDRGGHGTHTLGSVLGKSVGLAPEAQWIGCVNLARNLGNPAVYLDCMQFMLAPFPQSGDPWRDGKPELGANVLNNSWGCPLVEGCDAGTYLQAVRALQTAGVFVVASAGNEGRNGCGSLTDPLAIYPDVFTVGALTETGDRAEFSSLGPVHWNGQVLIKPDLMAPGQEVLSSFPQNSYATLSGTSMAGPHVVGAVALMWSANPRLVGNVARTRQILEQTARPYQGQVVQNCGSSGTPNNVSGYGNLDAYAAVKMALTDQ